MKARALAGALLCLAALFLPAAAQGPAAAGSGWTWVRGEAVDLAAGAGGALYAAGPDGALWQWIEGTRDWKPLPGSATRIAAAQGVVWAVRKDGALVRHAGGRETVFPFKARDVAADPQGNAYAVRVDGRVLRLRAGARDWEELPPVDPPAQRVAAHSDGSVWVVREDGTLARHDGQAWQPLPGRAKDIAIAPDGTAYAPGTDGVLLRWDAASNAWHPQPDVPGAALVAIAADGTPWVANEQGAILTRAVIKEEPLQITSDTVGESGGITFHRGGWRAGGGGRFGGRGARAAARGAAFVAVASPAKTTDPSPFEWIDTRATAAELAIGMDGSVFALGLDNNLYRWSNAQSRFLPFPGSLLQIAVDPGGNPWGINSLGRIFRHDGSDWRQVSGTASDIGIGADGTVLIADASGVLSRFSPDTMSFTRIAGQALTVAVAPDGRPWGLLQDGTVVRCGTSFGCSQLGRRARSLAIGPDGSVFIVSLDNRLQRFIESRSEWEIIPVLGLDVLSVAVGPRGRPWVVVAGGRVYASSFFPRDESTDLQMAASTQTPTTGSGDTATVITDSGSGFQFSKKFTFQSYPIGMAVLDDVSVGPDGTGLALGDNGHRLQRFNPKTKAFEDDPNLPPEPFRFVQTDPEGRLWFISAETDGRIYRQKKPGSNAFDIFQLPIVNPVQPPAPMNCGLAVGPDGTVYAIDTAGTLFRKPPNASKFTKFISGVFRGVTVSRANEVWVLDDNFIIKQIVGTKAERRPPNKNQFAIDLGGGNDGSLFIIHTDSSFGPMPARWNATNQTFDDVKQPANRVEVGPDGRPWLVSTFTGQLFIAK